MNARELEDAARRGEEVARFLASPAVREVIGERQASAREAILALASGESGRFARLKAGLEALEELVSALEATVRAGEEARAALAGERASRGAARIL